MYWSMLVPSSFLGLVTEREKPCPWEEIPQAMDSDDREPALENDADDGKSDRSSELRVDLQNAEFPFKA